MAFICSGSNGMVGLRSPLMVDNFRDGFFVMSQNNGCRGPGEWQTYDITLVGRVVTVMQNGHTIIDKQEIPGITGGALESHEGLPGPIYLQGSEAGHVAFRNIMITRAR